jgi:hypothetical protein
VASLIAVGALYTVFRPFRPWESPDSWHGHNITRNDVRARIRVAGGRQAQRLVVRPRYSAFDMNNTTPAAGSYTVCAKPAAS